MAADPLRASASRAGSAALPACVVAGITACLTGCASLAPTYERPAPPIAATWPVAEQAPSAAGAVVARDIAWYEFYGDSRLRQLIAMALAHNRDLRATALDIESARAQYRIAYANTLPTIVASGARTAQGAGARASSTAAATTSQQYSVELGISAFEIDFFGRLRNLKEQALETFLASEETLRAARISLVAEVALAYLTLAADQRRLRLAEDTLASQRTSFELTRKTFELGQTSALDVAQAETSVETARADIATYRTQMAQDLNALALLVGQPLTQASASQALPLDGERPVISRFTDLGVGLPSELLQRRPDVLAAERGLRAANANIGAARAQLFPSITLTTSLGTASRALSELFGSGTRTWSFVPAITRPIFDAGALRANLRAAEVQRDIALATYEKTIQVAFREVADALAQRRDIDELIAARQALVAATEKSYRLSDARYRKGVDSYLNALDAQRSLYSAQQNLITARLLQDSNLVTLYSVLGGGWQAATSP